MEITTAHRQLADKFMYKKVWKTAMVPDSLRELVAYTYTEEESEIVNALQFAGKSAKVIAQRVNRPLEEVEPILQSLEERYLIACYGTKEPKKYSFLQLMPGLFEVQMMLSKDRDDEFFREFARLYNEFYEEIMIWLKPKLEEKTLSFERIIPIEKAIEKTPGLGVIALPTDIYSEMLDRNKSYCIVDPCACRQEMELLGRGCDKPKDVCSAMGWVADMAVGRGMARRVTREEFMETKLRAAEAGLVNMVDNLHDPVQVCSCCSCCCGALTMVKKLNIPNLIVQSHFEAQINKDVCKGCEVCVKKCPVDAITVKDKKAELEQVRCIGCGICVINCKDNAITLKERANYTPPDETGVEFILNRFFEIKGYKNPILPKISLGVGRLISSIVPFHLTGPKYKPPE